MISAELAEYLRHCGLSEKKIIDAKPETELFGDFGIYGDIAEAYMETLERDYKVDMSVFRFEDYFPSEFVGTSVVQRVIYWIVPLLAHKQRQAEDLQPVTLQMIDNTIRNRRWTA